MTTVGAGTTGILGYSSFWVGGTRVDAVDTPQAIATLRGWITAKRKGRVAFCTASTVVEAATDPALADALEGTDLVTADGMPLVWLGRRKTGPGVERVYGPDFMIEVIGAAGSDLRHFFFGGGPGVADEMARRLQARFPEAQIVGTLSPENISGTELNLEHAAQINAARPDIVWVGLGHPKQELWMQTHQGELDASVLAGVGAAFDFHSGRKKEAPDWIKRSGLQWMHRFLSEPRRLWRRYLIGNAKFLFLVARDSFRVARSS